MEISNKNLAYHTLYIGVAGYEIITLLQTFFGFHREDGQLCDRIFNKAIQTFCKHMQKHRKYYEKH